MLTIGKIDIGAATNYYEKTAEQREEYYSKHMTSYDRFRGSLAESLGLAGEMTADEFHKIVEHQKGRNLKVPFIDLTFSAPKSVSLLQAHPDYAQDVMAAQDAAIAAMIPEIEANWLQVTIDDKKVGVHNAIFCDFRHEVARPTEENGFVADPDMHDHLLLASICIVNGKERAIDFSKILNSNGRASKELGLLYRQFLARELIKREFELEVTDEKQGFFRVKGFTEEVEKAYSHRTEEIQKTMVEKDMDVQQAKKVSRTSKDKSRAETNEILQNVRENIFEGENAIRVTKKKEAVRHERRRRTEERSLGDTREILDSGERRSLSDAPDLRDQTSKTLEGHLSRRPSGLQDMLTSTMDGNGGLERSVSKYGNAERSAESDLLVSQGEPDHLAELQARSVRDSYLRKTRTAQGRDRVIAIDKLTDKVIKDILSTEYAIPIPKLKQRIRAAGVLMDLSDREITKAIDRSHLIELGRRIGPDGRPSKDRYLTTRETLEIEPRIEKRVKEGKGVFRRNGMDEELARKLLQKVEKPEYQLKKNVPKNKIFRIEIDEKTGQRAEQGEALIGILSNKNRYLAINGLAGTGKTTLMQRLQWIAEDQHIEVKGLAFTGKAAQGLEAESGIKSSTIHSFLNRLERESQNRGKPEIVQRLENSPVAHGIEAIKDKWETGEPDQIKQDWDLSKVRSHGSKREIWIVDEAGLVDMRLMDKLMEAAERRNVQVVFAGDPKQLPPVGAGAPFQWMIEKYGLEQVYLEAIRRQRNAAKYIQQAVLESVVGSAKESIRLLKDNGSLLEIKSAAERRQAVIDEMTKDKLADYKNDLLLVSTNVARKDYNEAIRSIYVQRGEIEEGEEYTILSKQGNKLREEKRHFALGDRIIFGQNSKTLDVKNGEMGTLIDINADGEFVVRVDGDKEKIVKFSPHDYKQFDHAYAVTVYKAQGMTVKKVVCDYDTKSIPQTRNTLYVGISRTKDQAIVFTDSIDRLEKQTVDFATKDAAEVFERGEELLKRGVALEDEYHPHDTAPEEAYEKQMRDIERTTGPAIEDCPEALSFAPSQDIQREQEREHTPTKDAHKSDRIRSREDELRQEREAPQEAKEASETQERGQAAERLKDKPQAVGMEAPSQGMEEARELAQDHATDITILGSEDRAIEAAQEAERDAQRGVEREADYEPPYEVQDYNDLDHVWNVIDANQKERQNIYDAAYDEAVRELGKDTDDPRYKELTRELRDANEDLSKAKTSENAAIAEQQGRAGTEQKLADAQAALNASVRKDQAHSGWLHSIGYKSQTQELETDRDKAKARDDAAKEKQAKAKEAREKAQEHQAKALEALKQYKKERDAAIKQRVYQKAPVLHEYDEALAQDRSYYKKARTIAREAARAVEKERSRDSGRSFR